jgi:hypothetical protein
MATAADVDVDTYRRHESGNDEPDAVHILAYAFLLEVDVEELLFGVSEVTNDIDLLDLFATHKSASQAH